MKSFYFLSILYFISIGSTAAQTTVFNFTFENTESVTVHNAVVTPTFAATGVDNPNYFNGAALGNCPTISGKSRSYANWQTGDKYRFTVNTTGYSGLTFDYCSRTSNLTVGNFICRVSPDGTNWTTIVGDYVPAESFGPYSGTLPASCSDVNSVFIELYKTDNADNSGNNMRVDNAILTATCARPTEQAIDLNIVKGTAPNSFDVSLTRGDGDNVIVLVKDGGIVNSNPVFGTSYAADSNFGSGSQIGTGNYVVYIGTGDNFTVTGLTEGHTYYFAAFEFNNCGPLYLRPAVTGSALPISLTSFKAARNNKHAQLSFSTALERDNDYFSIERSADASRFTEIGQVPGAGDSNVPKDYTFTDEQPLPGKNYYRLRQVDFDGTFSYSNVVSVDFGSKGGLMLSPVPAVRNQLRVTLEKAQEDGVWQILDMSGRVIRSGIFPAETEQYEFQTGEMPEGVYVFQLTLGQVVMAQPFWR